MPWLLGLVLCLLVPGTAGHGQEFAVPPRPSSGVYRVDEARVLGAEEGAEIDRISGTLLRERGFPIVVVVLRDLGSRREAGSADRSYAAELFDHWGVDSKQRDRAMLLLVGAEDRHARLELGPGWGSRLDAQAKYLTERLVLPEIRAGRYSTGVLAGVRGLDAMARGLELPKARQPWWLWPVSVGIFLMVAGLVFALGGGTQPATQVPLVQDPEKNDWGGSGGETGAFSGGSGGAGPGDPW